MKLNSYDQMSYTVDYAASLVDEHKLK